MRRKLYPVLLAAGTLLILTSCGKQEKTTGGNYVSPSRTQAETTTAADSPKVKVGDISAFVGDDIDYLANIESAENMELSRSMIYIDSSGVDRFTPGVYKVYYTFDYMGTTVDSEIKVTIRENPNPTTIPEPETDTTEAASEDTASASDDTSGTGMTSEAPSDAAETEERNSISSTEPVSSAPEAQPIGDASITLSNGKVVTIPCTSTRYITETYTEETYFEENGLTFLKEELKIVFNTGESQVVETVVNRVMPPETSPEAAS